MKKIKLFLKGGFLGMLTILAIALLMALILLILKIDLNVDNTFVTIYSYAGSANVKFHGIPTLVAFVIGGLIGFSRNGKNISDDILEESETNNIEE